MFDINDLSFDECFGLMVDCELIECENMCLSSCLKLVWLCYNVCLEDIDYCSLCGLDKFLIL